jgi:hypothetical protein
MHQMALVVREISFIFVVVVRFGDFYWYCKLLEKTARVILFPKALTANCQRS